MQEMSSGGQVEALRQQQLDVGLLEPIAVGDDIEMMLLLSESLVVVLPDTHPLVHKEKIALSQLADDPWVTGRSHYGCGLLLKILEACQQAGYTPKVQQETNDLQMILGFVASGQGVTLLPESSMRSQKGVVYCSLQPPVPELQLAISWNRQTPVIDSFCKL